MKPTAHSMKLTQIKKSPMMRKYFFHGMMALVMGLLVGCGGEDETTKKNSKGDKQKEEEEVVLINIDLGQFNVNEMRPTENQTLKIAFSIFAVVDEKQKEAFEASLEKKQHAIRDQVITAIRTAETPEFDEIRLNKIRERIRLRVETFTPDIPIKDIYLTSFRCQID